MAGSKKKKSSENGQWKNRLIDVPSKPASEFKANPLNFRIHPPKQQAAVVGSLKQSGWVQPVLVNRTTGHTLDGHERIDEALANNNALVPYIEVEISEEEEGVVIASLDPIAALAKINEDKLEEIFVNINVQNQDLLQFLNELAEDNGILFGDHQPKYTRNIKAPIYKPKNKKPKLSDLFDDTKYQELVGEINRSDLDEKEKNFLRVAAQRHIVFKYDLIADYYAHADRDLQELMENSALIIIDFDRALELGYVQLSHKLAKLYKKDYPHD